MKLKFIELTFFYPNFTLFFFFFFALLLFYLKDIGTSFLVQPIGLTIIGHKKEEKEEEEQKFFWDKSIHLNFLFSRSYWMKSREKAQVE